MIVVNLTRCQDRVYFALLSLLSAGQHPTRRALAEIAGCHPVTVSRCMHDLQNLGVIAVHPVNGGCPRYEILREIEE